MSPTHKLLSNPKKLKIMEKEQKICFGFLGNGLTAWTSYEDKGPHLEAHISPERKITYYQENTPAFFIDAVEKQAQDNAIIGDAHFVFRPKSKPTKYCDTRFCGRILICEEMCDGVKHLCTQSGQLVDNWKNVKDYNPDDKHPVFIIGNLKRNSHGQLCGNRFGFSFSKEVAENAAEAIRNWKSDYWRNCVVEECTQDYLVQSSFCDSLVNLDWKD